MPLARAIFQRLTPDLARVEQELKVQFNPEKFTLDKGAHFPEVAIPGLDSPLLQFVRGQTESLTLELFFDTTMADDETMDPGETRPGPVTRKTDAFYQLIKIDRRSMAPPVCRFVWGRAHFPGAHFSGGWETQKRENGFQGIVENVRQELALFSSDGTPLRSTLTVSMKEYKPLRQQLQEIPQEGDRHQAHVVAEGETLAGIAAQAYGDGGNWRAIADANQIADPSRIPAGTTLRIPVL